MYFRARCLVRESVPLLKNDGNVTPEDPRGAHYPLPQVPGRNVGSSSLLKRLGQTLECSVGRRGLNFAYFVFPD
jgi:hypothetical protein